MPSLCIDADVDAALRRLLRSGGRRHCLVEERGKGHESRRQQFEARFRLSLRSRR